MHNTCVNIVHKLGKTLAQVSGLFTLSTIRLQHPDYLVLFTPTLATTFKQPGAAYRQPFLGTLKMFGHWFYTLPTGPIKNTNLIKE
jgi:hypothetical protein